MSAEIETTNNEVTFTIEKAKRNNDYTICFEKSGIKKYVLSKYNPREDAVALLKDDFGNKQTVWIILGFGFGYIIDEIINNVGDNATIMVIEPSLNLLEEQLKVLDDKQKSKMENVHFFADNDSHKLHRLFVEVVPESELNNIKIISLDKYLEFYSEYYQKMINLINDATDLMILNKNTRKIHGNRFVKNIVQNRKHIKSGYDLTVYKDYYKDIPAVVVSAGPSLSKNIHFIKQFKGVVFTGGRTLTPILEQGIEPDFLVSLDPKEEIYDTLLGNAENEIPLVTLDKASHKLLAAHKGKKYFVRTEEITESALGVKMESRLDMGGSVATLCISAAQYMGCNPIVFIGQDLANTNLKEHADICSNERNGLGSQQNLSEEKMAESGYKKIKGYYNDEVWSNASLISFLRWIEKFIRLTPETTYINATEGGAFIEGSMNETFESIVTKFSNVIKPRTNLLENQPNNKIDVEQNIQKTLDILKKLEKIVNSTEILAFKLLQEYKTHSGLRLEKIKKIVDKLDENDKEILKLDDSKNIVTYLFDIAYTTINAEKEQKEKLNETQLEKDLRIASYSYKIYKALNQSITETKQIIEVVLDAERTEIEQGVYL